MTADRGRRRRQDPPGHPGRGVGAAMRSLTAHGCANSRPPTMATRWNSWSPRRCRRPVARRYVDRWQSVRRVPAHQDAPDRVRQLRAPARAGRPPRRRRVAGVPEGANPGDESRGASASTANTFGASRRWTVPECRPTRRASLGPTPSRCSSIARRAVNPSLVLDAFDRHGGRGAVPPPRRHPARPRARRCSGCGDEPRRDRGASRRTLPSPHAADEEARSNATRRCGPTVDWSYSLLDGTEQLVFARLGTFPTPSTLRRPRRLSPDDGIEGWDVLDALGSLVDEVDARRRRRPPTPRPGTRCSKPCASTPASASTRPATPTLGGDATPSTTPPSLRSSDRACTASTSSPGGPGCAPSSTTSAPRSTGPSIPPPPATPTSRSASSPPWPTNCPWTQQLMSASGRQRAIPRADETTAGRRTAILGAAAVHAMFLGDLEAATTLARDGSATGCHPTALHR